MGLSYPSLPPFFSFFCISLADGLDFDRLRTRMAWVQNSEQGLEEKRLHCEPMFLLLPLGIPRFPQPLQAHTGNTNNLSSHHHPPVSTPSCSPIPFLPSTSPSILLPLFPQTQLIDMGKQTLKSSKHSRVRLPSSAALEKSITRS